MLLLLADVFENFRNVCLNHYKLDPAHYFLAPGLAWDACLKETKQKLQLLNDYDMLMFFKKGIRGGMTHIPKRYSEANNKYMKDYNPEKKSKFIQYLDANNLYGWAMPQRLPTHGFKWMNENKLSNNNIINLLNLKKKIMVTYLNIKKKFDIPPDHPSKIKTGINKKVIGMFKDEVAGKQSLLVIKFVYQNIKDPYLIKVILQTRRKKYLW